MNKAHALFHFNDVFVTKSRDTNLILLSSGYRCRTRRPSLLEQQRQIAVKNQEVEKLQHNS